MDRILIIVACNFAYWHYDDGSTSRVPGWDYCQLERKPAARPSLDDAVVLRRRARPPRRAAPPAGPDGLVRSSRRGWK